MGRRSAPRPFLARLRRATSVRTAPVGAVAATALALAAPVAAQGPAPAGPEFRVNTFTTGVQGVPAVARDAGGAFVVAWQSDGQDGSGFGVFAQRYSASGVPQGAEFRVNTYTTSNQLVPAVAMNADGVFVVVWNSNGQDGSSYGVYGQRYSAAGMPQGGEFRVNTYTTSFQLQPSVAMNATGGFVVTWWSLVQDGGSAGVYAQHYDAGGVAQGEEFRVNTTTTGSQDTPSVAMDREGDFVVAWVSNASEEDPDGGIFAQRFSAERGPEGPEFRVNTYTTDTQSSPDVAMDAAGDFAVAWVSRAQDGDLYGVYAQLYAADGTAEGRELRVNTATAGVQRDPAVAMDAAGDVTVAWASYPVPGGDSDVYAQRFSATGLPVGGEFRVNTTTTGKQTYPAVAADATGWIVAAWTSEGPSGSLEVYAQRFTGVVVASAPAPAAGLALDLAPNPTAGGGLVRYAVPAAGPVRLAVYDALGREVAVLADGAASAGGHETALPTRGLAPGVYVVRLTAGLDVHTQRFTVVR